VESLISLNKCGAFAIDGDHIDALLGLDNADALRLYLWLLKNSGGELAAAAKDLKLPAERAGLALSALQSAGLTGNGRPKPAVEYDIPAEYSPAEISGTLEADMGFKWLIEDASRRLGRVFSATDIGIMLRIYRWLGLPVEVIGVLVTYCIDRARRKNGEGRMPTLRQIEKEALVWEANSITSAERADEYVKKMTQAEQRRNELLGHLGIGSITASVERYVDQWIEWGYGEEELYHALDLTVRNTGGVKFPYMNSIVKNWQAKGLFSLADITKKDRRPASPAAKSGPGQRERDIVMRNQSYREGERDV
jgi:hypothetical protein